MTELGCSRSIRWLFPEVLVLVATSWTQTRRPILERTAETYRLDSFGKLKRSAVRGTDSCPRETPPVHGFGSQKTNKVSYEGQDKNGKALKVTYMRSELSSQPDIVKNEVDPAFIYDSYGLLGPFHIYWETSATVIDEGMHKLPVGDGLAKLVEVKYPNEGGYTPGDTYEPYVGGDNHAEQFVYHRGGPQKPRLMIEMSAGYKKAGPLLISTEHLGTADGKALDIFFSDISVRLVGSDRWMKAE